MTSEDLIASLPPLGGVLREAWESTGWATVENDNAAALAVAKVVVEHVLRELGPVAEILREPGASDFKVSWLRPPGPNDTKLYTAPHPRSEE